MCNVLICDFEQVFSQYLLYLTSLDESAPNVATNYSNYIN